MTAGTAFGGTQVVVTGSAGFIGTHLVRALARAGAAVIGIDRRAAPPGAPGAHHRLDLGTDDARVTLGELLSEADAVFHLAARPGVRGHGAPLERARWRDNVDAGQHVVALTPAHVPLVVTSSSSVYGGARRCHGRLRASREDDVLAPLGGYARTKVALEAICARRAAAGGVVAVARPFTVAGEGQRSDMALSQWLDDAARGRPVRVLGSLTRCRDVTDVHDVVRGLLALAVRGETTTVNLGTGSPVTLGDLVDEVATVVARPIRVVVAPAGAEEPPATRAHTQRCRAVCGFVPRTDLTSLVRRQRVLDASPAAA
jgi:nucleoside-diphosphate-sugar epimerase